MRYNDDRFFVSLFDASAPLILWAVYLFGVYAYAAVACDTAFAYVAWSGYSAIKIVLLGVTVPVVLGLLAMLLRAARYLKSTPHSLMAFARVGIAVLGLIGVVWSALPMLLMTSCIR